MAKKRILGLLASPLRWSVLWMFEIEIRKSQREMKRHGFHHNVCCGIYPWGSIPCRFAELCGAMHLEFDVSHQSLHVK